MTRLQAWQRGDPITALRLNNMQQAIPGVTLGVGNVNVKNVGGGVVIEDVGNAARVYRTVMQRFIITAVHDEYVTARPYNAIKGEEVETDYHIAKPKRLRIGVEELNTKGVEFYTVGDEIIAHIGILGQTGVETVADLPDNPSYQIEWEDANANGFGAPILVELTEDAGEFETVLVKRVNYDGTLGDTEYLVWELAE